MNLYAMLCNLLNMAGMFTGLFKLQDLVKVPPTVRTEMYIRQATPGTYRQVLREIRQKEIYKLIVDTNPRHMQQFFRAVSTTMSNLYFACHNIQRFAGQNETKSVSNCGSGTVFSWVTSVGIGTKLTVGLQGISALFPLSERYWGPKDYAIRRVQEPFKRKRRCKTMKLFSHIIWY
jgi:hypothetical protein